VQVLTVVLVFRPTVEDDFKTDVVTVDCDAKFLSEFSDQRAHQILIAVQMTGRQSQLPVAVTRAGPTHQEHAALLNEHTQGLGKVDLAVM